jgi:excisionase family DNA binding protein
MDEPSRTPADQCRRADQLLTPGEVAAIFRVDSKTVNRWAASGRIRCIKTPGGHRRFERTDVLALLLAGREAAS